MAAADPNGHRRGWLLLGLLIAAVAIVTLVLTRSDSNGERPPTVSEHPAPAHGADCPTPRRVPGNAHVNLVLGMNSVWSRHCDEATLARAGVNWQRLELTWSRIEPAPGRFRWGAFDKQFATAARARMTVLPLLYGSPGWAAPGTNFIPKDPGAFADYTAAVAARYGPRGAFWRSHPKLPYRPASWFELWNEPYLGNFSADGPQPERYARLVQAATSAGRRANPQARFMIEADTTGLDADGGSSTPWVEGMYKAVPQLTQFFDAVAIHPYSAPHSPDSRSGQGRWQFRRIGQIEQSFRDHGAGNKPVWITELGWSTCPANGEECVSERAQAHYTGRAFQLLRSNYPFVRAVFLYNYRDSAEDPSNKEDWFGLFRSDGRPKPAWNVLARVARGLSPG